MTSQYMANFFVNEARKNHHKFPTQQMEDQYLIYNYNPVHSAKIFDSLLNHFEQIYIFEGWIGSFILRSSTLNDDTFGLIYE